jgi:hypothetical protein
MIAGFYNVQGEGLEPAREKERKHTSQKKYTQEVL